jgi:hypothetical protein
MAPGEGEEEEEESLLINLAKSRIFIPCTNKLHKQAADSASNERCDSPAYLIYCTKILCWIGGPVISF